MSDQTEAGGDALVERVACALCEDYGDVWGDAPEHFDDCAQGHICRQDWRSMAREAIAVVRQWDAGK